MQTVRIIIRSYHPQMCSARIVLFASAGDYIGKRLLKNVIEYESPVL